MTLEEFVRIEPSQIRRSERLMQLFVDFYEAAFFFKPKCAGCAFKKGFKKLREYSTKSTQKISKFENMETTKTFQLKKKYFTKILTFKQDGVTYRKYGNRIDEAFARNLVADGQTDLFDKLPSVGKEKEKVTAYSEPEYTHTIKVDPQPVRDYTRLDYRSELIPLYNTLSEKLGKEAKSRKKEDVIAFLKENED